MNFPSSRILLTGLLLVIFTACQSTVEQSETNKSESTVDMLQHTVYFYLNEDVTPEEKQQFEEGLKELLEISEIYKSELGVPADTEERDVTDHGYAYAIYTWFETMEDYKVYAEHPDHLDFIDQYSPLWADVKVYDADIISSPR